MAAELQLKVSATDLTKHQFVPANLTIRIGSPNNDLQTCDVYFELKDDGVFDTTKYTGLERIHRGNMNVPLSVIAVLINPDGSYNADVLNQWLNNSDLQLMQ